MFPWQQSTGSQHLILKHAHVKAKGPSPYNRASNGEVNAGRFSGLVGWSWCVLTECNCLCFLPQTAHVPTVQYCIAVCVCGCACIHVSMTQYSSQNSPETLGPTRMSLRLRLCLWCKFVSLPLVSFHWLDSKICCAFSLNAPSERNINQSNGITMSLNSFWSDTTYIQYQHQ